MNISVIVPTYNRPKALRLCLLSLARQSMLPTEVLIADDGSRDETKNAIQEMQSRLGQFFPIRHVWQEDIEFRKPMILNETVRRASGDYLIFIDGDCMAHRHFVRTHAERGDPMTILSGKRVEIGKRLTEALLEEGTVLNSISLRLLRDLAGDRSLRSRKVEEGLYISSRLIRKLAKLDHLADDDVFGCNFSLPKQLFIAINGCDEDFLDGSVEDNDLGIRVLNQGGRVRSMRGLAIIYHLWHPSSWNYESEKYKQNQKIILRRIENKETICKNGINKL